MPEKIACSAIWFDDKQKHDNQPLNILSGFVVCGLRHNNCYGTLHAVNNFATKEERLRWFEKLEKRETQGFLTTSNRFVNRSEAYKIAKESGQLKLANTARKLHSEDIF